jgi:hypothetical protein
MPDFPKIIRAAFLLALLGSLGLAGSATAASVQIGHVAGPTETGGCNQCTDMEVETTAPSPSYEVPAGSWELTSWSGQGGLEGGSVRLRIFRATATPGQFRLVAESPLETIAAETVATFPVAIPVAPGDRLGLETGPGTVVPNTYPTTFSGTLDDHEYGVVGAPKVGQTVGPGGEFEVGTNNGYLLNIAATLSTPQHALQLSVGTGGVVFDKPDGIDCLPGICGYRFDEGTPLALEALPAPGYSFSGWSGACAGVGVCGLSLSADATVGATFAPLASSISPSNSILLGHLRRNPRRETAVLPVTVPGPGLLALSSKRIVEITQQIAAAGTEAVAIKPTKKLRRTLMATGKAKVALRITFTPNGGTPNTLTRAIALRAKRA